MSSYNTIYVSYEGFRVDIELDLRSIRIYPVGRAKSHWGLGKRCEMNSRFQSRVGPSRRAMSAACTSAGGRHGSSAPHPRSPRRLTRLYEQERPRTGGVSSFQIFYLPLLLLLSASLFLDLQLFVTDRLSRLLVLFKRCSSGRYFPLIY